MPLLRRLKLNQNRNNDKQPSPDDYLRQDVYDTAGNGYIALTLVVALILNFLPLPDNALLFRPDFVALITLYWCAVSSQDRYERGVYYGTYDGCC